MRFSCQVVIALLIVIILFIHNFIFYRKNYNRTILIIQSFSNNLKNIIPHHILFDSINSVCYNITMKTRKLPIGIQTFERLRKENYLYVDKTEIIYQLIQTGAPVFLSRPRRFGKSLLISTIKAYFEGKKDLFQGLKMADYEKVWEVHPVIHIDFSEGGGYKTNEELKNALDTLLGNYEKLYNITEINKSYGIRLSNIIQTANKQTGKQVAVLIDEYDKPLLDALQTPDRDSNHDTMRSFYGVLKACDPYMCFLFLTGITKFAKVSIFSELNQLMDISMSEKYDEICGITEAEMKQFLMPEIEAFAESEKVSTDQMFALLKKKYDGYHFNETCADIYNPFSLLNALNEKRLKSYWFQTATPAMLFSLIENANYDLTDILDGVSLPSNSFSDYRIDGGSLTPIIYHSGYLTIKGYDKESDLYELRFPNDEVRDGFIMFLLPLYTSIPEDRLGLAVEHFRKAIATRDIQNLLTLFSAAISDLPTRRNCNMEYVYQVAFHAILRQTGFDVESEQQVIGGRVDISLQTSDTVYIFELKMDNGKAWEEVAQTALLQIEQKDYTNRYAACHKKIYKIALVFSTERGGLAGYKIAE